MVLSGLITSRSDLYRYRTGTMQASAVRLDFRWVYSFKIKIRDLALAKYWRIARLRSWIRFGATQGAWTPSQGNQTTPEIQKILESEKIGVGACRGSEIVNFYAKLACERPCRRFPAKLVCERPVSQISDLLVLFERC